MMPATEKLQLFSLIFCRFTPLFMAVGMSPLARIPLLVRLLCLSTLSVALVCISSKTHVVPEHWLSGLFFELLLGMLMLVGFQLAYTAIQIIGRVLDMQVGFAAAGVVDPVSQNNEPILGHILTLLFTVLFFVTDTHHLLLLNLQQSVLVIPPGSWSGQFDVSSLFAYFSSQLFIAIAIFLPVILGLWLLDLFNGVLAKSMPQMNVYFVMMPLKIGLGLFLLAMSLERTKPLVMKSFSSMVNWFLISENIYGR